MSEKSEKKTDVVLEEDGLYCVWNMDGNCSNNVEEVDFFGKQITIPVCSNHIEQHRHVMTLYKNGYDIEEALRQTPEWRKAEVLILELSGLDNSEVEL